MTTSGIHLRNQLQEEARLWCISKVMEARVTRCRQWGWRRQREYLQEERGQLVKALHSTEYRLLSQVQVVQVRRGLLQQWQSLQMIQTLCQQVFEVQAAAQCWAWTLPTSWAALPRGRLLQAVEARTLTTLSLLTALTVKSKRYRLTEPPWLPIVAAAQQCLQAPTKSRTTLNQAPQPPSPWQKREVQCVAPQTPPATLRMVLQALVVSKFHPAAAQAWA